MTMTWLTDPDIWLSLLTLTVLEIVLGVDNLIFLSLISAKLPAKQRPKVRRLGLAAALVMRVLLLCTLVHLARMVEPVLSLGAHFSFSWRDLILLGGGLFLMYKSVREIHHDVDALEGDNFPSARPSFWAAVTQIMLLDLVFSIDSIITAVGLANDLPVMIAASCGIAALIGASLIARAASITIRCSLSFRNVATSGRPMRRIARSA